MEIEDDYETHITFISELGARETIYDNHKQQSLFFLDLTCSWEQGRQGKGLHPSNYILCL